MCYGLELERMELGDGEGVMVSGGGDGEGWV